MFKAAAGAVYRRPKALISTLPWTFPEVLDYWDASVGISQGTATERVSAWAPTLKGSDSLAQATAGNQPILLPFVGTNYLWLSGVTGNYASASDVALPGDLDLRCLVAKDSWQPASNTDTLISKDVAAGNQRSFVLQAGSTGGGTAGKLLFLYTNDGSTFRTATSSVAIATSNDYSQLWVRATYAVASGNVNFYTSPDGVTWNALGVQQTITAGTIFDSTAAVQVGTNDLGSNTFRGKIYRAQVYNGIAGTLVFDANFTAVPEGATSFTESSSNAATVTINSTGAKPAYVVGSQIIMGDAAAYFLQSTFTLNAPYFVVEVAMKPTWASGQVSWDGKTANSFALQDITGSPQQRLHDGSANGATKSPVLSTWYVKAAKQDSSGNATFQLNLNAPTADTLSHTAMAGFTAFADGSGANFASGMKKAIAVGNADISAARLNQLIAAMALQTKTAL